MNSEPTPIEVKDGRQQIEGRNIDVAEFTNGSTKYRKTATTVLARQWPVPFAVHTPEGVMNGEAGDYLVSDDPPTHAWPAKREIFEATHEFAKPEP